MSTNLETKGYAFANFQFLTKRSTSVILKMNNNVSFKECIDFVIIDMTIDEFAIFN